MAFDIATRNLAPLGQPGGDFFGINTSNDGRIMIFAGGIPLRRAGEVVGAIGVSGGSGKQDQAVAEAGAAAFSYIHQRPPTRSPDLPGGDPQLRSNFLVGTLVAQSWLTTCSR